MKFAAAPQGKSYLLLQPLNKDEYQLISDGQKNWAYVPKLKQYTEEEGAAVEEGHDEGGDSDSERDMAETFARQVMSILARLEKTAAQMDANGRVEVKYGKKKVQWPNIRVLAKQDRDGTTLTQLALDPETLRIARMTWVNISQSAKGEKTVLRMVVEFQAFQLGEAPPETLFTFAPPKGTKLADTLPIPGQTGSFLLNHVAPDFELKSLEGEKVRLADLRGKPVLLSFWASWCGPCRRELPGLEKVYNEYKSKGLAVYGVNDEGKGPARKFVETAGLTFPTLDDSGLKAHRLYRVHSIPTVFVIDAQGKVVRFFRGTRSAEDLRTAMKAAGL